MYLLWILRGCFIALILGVGLIVLGNYPEDAAFSNKLIGLTSVLLIGGLAFTLNSIQAVADFGQVVLAVLVTGLGLGLTMGPWLVRLANDLGRERRERIRQEERAEMAAHLHDSVLQTLALIQRTDDPKRMSTLARAQERELRAWLYERAPVKTAVCVEERAALGD